MQIIILWKLSRIYRWLQLAPLSPSWREGVEAFPETGHFQKLGSARNLEKSWKLSHGSLHLCDLLWSSFSWLDRIMPGKTTYLSMCLNFLTVWRLSLNTNCLLVSLDEWATFIVNKVTFISSLLQHCWVYESGLCSLWHRAETKNDLPLFCDSVQSDRRFGKVCLRCVFISIDIALL